MHLSYSGLILAALALDSAIAQPARHGHKHLRRLDLADILHEKRQDWNDPALYKDVNWATVNYGGGASTPAPPPAPAPAPAPAPSPAASPVAAPENVAVQQPAQSSPAPTVQATNTDTTSSSGKRGLAYNPTSPSLSIFDSYSKITWGYNWDSAPAGLPSQFQYVPMLWSTLPVHTDEWSTNAKAAISGSGTHYLMSFNEPDMPAQANMDVGSAVSAFDQYMTPLASGNVKLGSPAVSNGVGTNPTTGRPQGLDWLKPFLQQCSNCPISFVPVHWYGCGNGCSTDTDVQLFKTQMQQAMDAAGKLPIWITEFQTMGDGEAFLNEVLPWLDGQGQVERYAYYMASSVSLTNGNAVSALGAKYASS